MTDVESGLQDGETTVTVRYWAGARAAAGTAEESLTLPGPASLADVVRRVLALHPDQRMADVIGVCSVLVGERPASSEDPEQVVVPDGASVEFLPPFAGG
jgi:molybdopterin converting factor small subunit